ncbi:MAG: carboxypeptidase regulatory-like domain-containing protein [Gemmatimonadales bacterium]
MTAGAPLTSNRTRTRFIVAAGVFFMGNAFASRADAQRSSYVQADVRQPARVSGRVTLLGRVPRPQRLLITKDTEVCGEGFRIRPTADTANGRGLRNVVIVIEGVTEGKPWPTRNQPPVLDQADCFFQPHLQLVRRSDTLTIVNSDPVLHNVHTYELFDAGRRTLFNYGQPPEREVIHGPIRPRRGNIVRIECDAHDFMLGWIYVIDNPYAAVVDATGAFSIDGIPPGTYTIRAWSPYLGTVSRELTFAPNSASELIFEFPGD